MCPRALELRQMGPGELLVWDLHGVCLFFPTVSCKCTLICTHMHACARTHTHPLQNFRMCHPPDKNISMFEENLMLIQKVPWKAEHSEKAAMTQLS